MSHARVAASGVAPRGRSRARVKSLSLLMYQATAARRSPKGAARGQDPREFQS
jgi:hypothetical protein